MLLANIAPPFGCYVARYGPLRDFKIKENQGAKW